MRWRTETDILHLKDLPTQIRNICLLAHVDHGKTTFADSLIASNQIISGQQAGQMRYLDSRPDEQERKITMKSSSIPLVFQESSSKYLVNLIDSPGHIDFSCEVASALRVCDGALVLVDAVEGVRTQTQSVLRQAWDEGIKMVLVLNKIDRLILDQGMQPFEAFVRLSQIIERVNSILSMFQYEYEQVGRFSPYQNEEEFFFAPEKLNVIFCSAYDKWAFTLKEFALMYSVKLGFNAKKLCSYLWGYYYFNPKNKQITKKPPSPNTQPMFVSFILDYIWRIYNCVQTRDVEKIRKMLSSLNISIEERFFKQLDNGFKSCLRAVMSTWLPLYQTTFKVVIATIPSPDIAQSYRSHFLFPQGSPFDETVFDDVKRCNQEGNMTGFISKIISDRQNQLMLAFTRIYSGTLESNQIVKIIENNGNIIEAFIEKLYILIGCHLLETDQVKAGMIVGIEGLQDIVFKTATISSSSSCPVLTPMTMPSTPIVKVAIQPEELNQMSQLIQGLKKLEIVDNSVEVHIQDTGEHILAVCGEVHLQKCIKDLEEIFAGVPIQVSQPIVGFKETVIGSGNIGSDLTSNKRCKISIQAMPLCQEIVNFLDTNKQRMRQIFSLKNPQNSKREFLDDFTQIINDFQPQIYEMVVNHLVAFGPGACGNNLLVYPQTQDSILTQEINEDDDLSDQESDEASSTAASRKSNNITTLSLQQSLVTGFDLATYNGPLCDEPISSVLFIVENIEFYEIEGTDPYGPFQGQIVSATKDACRKAVLQNMPRLLEGVYDCEFTTSQESLGRLFATIQKRRGQITEQIANDDTYYYICKALLPVAESFGFSDQLRSMTHGSVVPQLQFSHWQLIKDDPFHVFTEEEIEEWGDNYELENLAKKYINEVRQRKGLPTEQKLVQNAERQRTLTKMR